MQPFSQRHSVLWRRDIDPHNSFTPEGLLSALKLARGTKAIRARGITPTNVEVRDLTVIPHQERAAVFEYPEQVHDRRTVLYAVAGLEDEPARRGPDFGRLLLHGYRTV